MKETKEAGEGRSDRPSVLQDNPKTACPSLCSAARKASPGSAPSRPARGAVAHVCDANTHMLVCDSHEGSGRHACPEAPCARTHPGTHTRVQVPGPGVHAPGSACVFACSLQTCFHKAQGEAISHLRGILATPSPGKAASWSGNESAQGQWGGGSLSREGLQARLAGLPGPGHCSSTCVQEHIPGTGQRRRLEGFSPPPPSPPPVPPHTRPFIFPSCCKTKTPRSGVQELEPNGRSWWLRGWTQEWLP